MNRHANLGPAHGAPRNGDAMSTLVWGIKESLLAYVRGMGDGEVRLDGATQEPSGFAFPDAGGEGHSFTGSVSLSAHGGLMDVTLADPALVPDGDHWLLTIAEPYDAAARLPFARIDTLTPQAGFLIASGTTLTADGADLFFGPYTAGTPLDDPFVRD